MLTSPQQYAKRSSLVAVALVVDEPHRCKNPGAAQVVASPGEYVVNPGSSDEYPIHPDRLAALYAAPGAFDFGCALAALKAGRRVRRAGWNGKGMHLELVRNGTFQHPSDTRDIEPFIVMWTAQQSWVPWLASQADVLALDWEVAP